MRRVIRLISILFILLVIAFCVLALRYNQYVHSPLSVPDTTLFTVQKGETARDILARVDNKSAEAYLYRRIFTRLNPQLTAIKSGTYEVTPAMGLIELMALLVSGKEKLFSITLVEGLRWQDWWQQLQQHPRLLSGEFDAQDFVREHGLVGHSLEGWLLPDTYHFPANTQVSQLVRQAYTQLTQLLDAAWAERDADLPLQNPYEALILASIIEKETAVAEERPLIAGVFINRLRKGMRLQTDPTVIYGMGASFDGNIRRADLRTRTPYNTYMIDGLPPTPIAMPSAEAINAALSPVQTDALYFVARGDGSHQFSATLAEHNAAVRKYQLKQD